MSDTVIDASAPEATHLYDLVVIGCSAGGIEALSRITAVLPADFPAPIVVAQHLDPNGTSHLSDILARRSSLPLHALADRKETAGAAAEHGAVDNVLLPGVVYVVPPDRDVEIQDSTALLRSSAERHPKPSIDQLFASAAAAYGKRLIAVVLTGTGSDGSMGARSVKAAGGLVHSPEET
jgi:two-component system, chemotaxis family, CheB/CheR fusion protein